MTWRTLTGRDRREWKLNETDPCDRDVRRSNVRSAVHADSQLPGGEPIDVVDAPAQVCTLNLNADEDDDERNK